MPYNPPSRRGKPEGESGHQAFSQFMQQANASATSLVSRRRFHERNDTTASSSESDSQSTDDSLVLLPVPEHLSQPPPLALPLQPNSLPPDIEIEDESASTFPLNRLLAHKGPSVAQISAIHSADRQENENAAILFTTKSPQSYSYALMSPNSMALRLKVLKRSLEILLERPEWLSSNVYEGIDESAIVPPSSILAANNRSGPLPPPPMLRQQSAASTSSSVTSMASSLGTIPSTQSVPPPSYGSIALRGAGPFARRGSTTVNVMDNVLKLERNAKQSNPSPLRQPSLHQLATIHPTSSRIPPKAKTTNAPTLGSVSVDKSLLEDLKQIIHFLESGIEPDLTQDQASKMINLHNLSLTNAERMPKKTSLKIQLLHALATPFEERTTGLNNVAGIPTGELQDGHGGLHSNWGSSESLYSQGQSMGMSSMGRQFHASSAGKTKSPKAVFTCELESPWKLLNSNDLACLMFGISRSLVKSLTLMDLISPRSRSLVFNRLQRHTEQVFSGEVIAIKRNNDGLAWTSLWAKRKESFVVLIFEQIPCDSLDVIMERAGSGDYRFESAKSYSTLFQDRKYAGKPLSDLLPTVESLVDYRDVPDLYKELPQGRRDTELINKVRYFTIRIEEDKGDDSVICSYAPCAVTSEELDPDDDEAEVRMNIHSLPYMAGTFVVSSNGYTVVSFNEAISKNLFGRADFQGKSIDCILPGFSDLLDAAIRENPGLLYEEGVVLPEHYWRKINAYKLGTTDSERELLFLRSEGIDGRHNDGHKIKVDVQMRIIDHDYFILWITYCRGIPGQGNQPSIKKTVSDSSLKDIAVRMEEKKVNIDKEKEDGSESLLHTPVTTPPSTSSSTSSTRLTGYGIGSMPSQLRLFPEVAGSLQTIGASSADMSRSSTTESDSSRSGGFASGTRQSTNSTTSSSSLEHAGTESSSSSLPTTASSESTSRYDDFKLENVLSEKALLKRENASIEEIRKHSKYFPVEVGKERRTKKVTDFRVVKNLGQGAYGKVVVAVRNGDPWYKVVLKAIFKERILVDTWVRDKDLGTIPSEIQILNAINKDPHPNIMRIVDFFEDDKCYYLETLQHGDPPAVDLFDLIEVKTDMTEIEYKYIYFQCCSALAHLHKHGIVHRDIKDENIIVDKDFVVKLIDFGSAAYTKDGPFGVFVGTIDYAAPEVLNGKPYDGKAQDVWAMGVLLYTLVFKENPFCSVDEILEGNLTFPRFHTVSQDCIDLIKSILVEGVNERPTMRQVLKNKWLEGFH
ncbi:DEKNAAC103583 [Brettanomyces naardenensis]|uniref:non-specific serine/threonine protein kinase n=1 Tax=Brettanomyces naardenensis TaxID=13370 RepID=A0A448YP15_BRENA|nr:DEKNAAC103583 [Brettanomyces naardenensis]